MPPFGCRFVAALSLLAAVTAPAATRPRHGGRLRIQMRAAPSALQPGGGPLAGLVFERLTSVAACRPENGGRRWLCRVRPGVRFHDGVPLTPAGLALALPAELNPTAAGDLVTLQSDRAIGEAPFVAGRTGDGGLVGTGPFRVAEWTAGRRAVLAAFDSYWGGRPFLDAIEIEMGRGGREQLLDLELGKTDLAEIGPGEWRRATERVPKLWSSANVELIALVYGGGRPEPETARLREALAWTIDRTAIHNVLLQRQGELSGGLLPQWLSGYAFLFATAPDLPRARRLVAEVAPASRRLTLGYDAVEGSMRLMADRIALNARDAGIGVQVEPQNARSDFRMQRVRIGSSDPVEALLQVAASCGLPEPPRAASPEALYQAERALLENYRAIPLFHLPVAYGASGRVRTWMNPALTALGEWRLENVWLAEGK